ncbi:unnamed protein product [Mycena citricolor]|uniref:Uncharacterized protein n=1 Tax=Mycena citricolor TaxID=2018698 RepID=A0AAD2H8J6_9AGAR|nr:unnamed protein product [Mycena citricolor]
MYICAYSSGAATKNTDILECQVGGGHPLPEKWVQRGCNALTRTSRTNLIPPASFRPNAIPPKSRSDREHNLIVEKAYVEDQMCAEGIPGNVCGKIQDCQISG